MKIFGDSFLITGGRGFVGSHVVEGLLEKGAKRVVVYDKLASIENLANALKDSRIVIIDGDILDRHRLSRALEGIRGVFHMAVLPLLSCEKNPSLAFEVNIRGTFTVIDEAIRAGVRKLVYSSASSVYGDTLNIMDEQHPFNPWTMYGISKLCGEFLLRPFHEKLPYVILRYMNIYGPGQTAGLIPTVLSKIKSGKPPIINGDGSATFDFLHVRDVAECTIMAMESDVTEEAFNVGSGTETTVKEIVTLLLQLTGSSLSPMYENAHMPVTRRVGCSEKAKRLLGFQPTILLNDGLAELVKGLRS
jgi:UDP-glucose 4-epimerase